MTVPDPQHDLETLARLSDLILMQVRPLTEAEYLATPALCETIRLQLCRLCETLDHLQRTAPGLAARISYRTRTAAFHPYLVGNPAQLRHDFVYQIILAQLPLLNLETHELLRLHTPADNG